MQRYFLQAGYNDDQIATIDGEDARHIMKVMRMRENDKIIAVFNEEACVCQIEKFVGDQVLVRKTGETKSVSEMPVNVTIACGLPKGDKLELIVQKGTELGMFGLLPFVAERSVVKWDAQKGQKKQERLQKIAKEAAEQSHRSMVPVVEQPVSFKELLTKAKDFDVVFFADEELAKTENRTRFADELKKVYDKTSILVIFGPEGGISRKEAEQLFSMGCIPIALGPRILRAETAPLYVLSAVSYEFE